MVVQLHSHFIWLIHFFVFRKSFFTSRSWMYRFVYFLSILALLFTLGLFLKINLFWLCWAFIAARRLSLVAASRGYSLVAVCRLLIVVDSEHGLEGLQAQELWYMGLVALLSSRSRNWTHVPCIGRQIPIHCTTREVPHVRSLMYLESIFCVWHQELRVTIFKILSQFHLFHVYLFSTVHVSSV